MPTGSVTLLESVKDSSDVLMRGVIETIIEESAPLQMLPQIPIQGNALKREIEGALPAVQFRDVGDTYTNTWASDTEQFWGVAILGGQVKIDNFIINTRGDVRSTKARQFAKFAKSMAHKYNQWFFDGTGTAKDFKGVNALIDDGHGQVQYAGANGAALTLDMLDEAHDALRTGSADQILCNRTVRRKITQLGRNLSNGFSLIDIGDNEFGHQVTMYDGVPIGIVGDDIDGNLILDYDETRGSSDVTTSLYFVRYGEDHVAGLMGAGGMMTVKDFGELQTEPAHLGRVEFYPGIAVFDQYSIVRLAGITNA